MRRWNEKSERRERIHENGNERASTLCVMLSDHTDCA